MSTDPDLAAAIAEVQVALERFRLAPKGRKRGEASGSAGRQVGRLFFEVTQAAFRRLNPSAPCPSLSGQVSMCHYLKRVGALGVIEMWCLGHIADCLVQHVRGPLTMVALDQSVIDHSC